MHKSRTTNHGVEFVSSSEEMTERFGEQLGRALSGGDVLGLIGELGSGKTTFVRGIAKGLGLDPRVVKSPTFVLLREYPGRIPLVHIDGYRLSGSEAAFWDDWVWVCTPDKVAVIEWADRVSDALPETYLEIRFAHASETQRTLTLIPHGSRPQQLAERLKHNGADKGTGFRGDRLSR